MSAQQRPKKYPPHTAYERELWAHIEQLEAERDTWRERANEMGIRWQDAKARIAELEASR